MSQLASSRPCPDSAQIGDKFRPNLPTTHPISSPHHIGYVTFGGSGNPCRGVRGALLDVTETSNLARAVVSTFVITEHFLKFENGYAYNNPVAPKLALAVQISIHFTIPKHRLTHIASERVNNFELRTRVFKHSAEDIFRFCSSSNMKWRTCLKKLMISK